MELFKDASGLPHTYLELIESAGKYVVRPNTVNDNLVEYIEPFYLKVNY